MTKAEAKKILREIEAASKEDLEKAIDYAESMGRSDKGTGTAVGAGAGALAGLLSGGSALERIAKGAIGGVVGGAAGRGIGWLSGRNTRKRLYNEIKRRKDEKTIDLISQMSGRSADSFKADVDRQHRGIQSENTGYGVFASGKGSYSDKEDKIPIKVDENGRPVLSLLFAGINSSVEDGGPASAKSPLAARFYNKNRDKFSDVQANTIFDDPVVADAYVDKIVAKIMANRAKTGQYPKIRLVGYSAGGRGVVNFLRKMRERDPNFRADEVIGIDAYQRPWEGIPAELRNKENPAVDKVVYSRLADNYTGSRSKGLGKLVDIISNTGVSLAGKKLDGLAANTVVHNYIPGIAHTDADQMYSSALDVLARLNKSQKNKENKNE